MELHKTRPLITASFTLHSAFEMHPWRVCTSDWSFSLLSGCLLYACNIVNLPADGRCFQCWMLQIKLQSTCMHQSLRAQIKVHLFLSMWYQEAEVYGGLRGLRDSEWGGRPAYCGWVPGQHLCVSLGVVASGWFTFSRDSLHPGGISPTEFRTRGRRVGRVRWVRATRQTSTDKGRGTLKSVGPWSRNFCDEPHCPTPEPVQPTAVVGTVSHLTLVRGTASGVSSSVRGAGIRGLES